MKEYRHRSTSWPWGCCSCLVSLLVAPLSLAAAPAQGPLHVHPDNPRYFTDGSKAADGSLRAVYLTGAHTWNSLVDMGKDDPKPFDFEAYLDLLHDNGHNFIRLWAWDSTVWDTQANGKLGKDFVHHAAPLPWQRTGPGKALDGKPKFDLTKFEPVYFERLRSRVKAAGDRGIYVSVMLFEGWGLMHGNRGRAAPEGWAWRSHPFHPDNNVNGIKPDGAGDLAGRVHHLGNKAVNDLQAAYIRKVVDTVNDLDNVLYEVINEGGQKEWDWWVVKTIKDHERTKPKQHPVGLTGHGAEKLESVLASPADWASPGRNDGYAEDPPAWDAKHKRVSLLDTDHIWGVGGNAAWVWKAFLRGHNPLFMDPYDGSVLGTPGDKQWEPIRRAMGDARRLAERVNLAAMAPSDDIASTKYCLADAGREYLAYLPEGGAVTMDLSAAKGQMLVEWFDTAKGKPVTADPVPAGAKREFKAPFDGPAVLYLKAAAARKPAAVQLRGEVLDADTKTPIPCRLYIQGDDGSWHFARSASPSGSAVEYRKQKEWNPASVEMHTTLSAHPFVASLPPGTYTVLVERGKEYLPESREVKIGSDEQSMTIRLRHWINMAEKGWFSGDTHVHRPLAELPNLLLAEDLNVAFPLTSWVTDAFTPPAKGRPSADRDVPAEVIRVDPTHVIYPRNTEYEIFRVGRKDHTLGAFFVLGHKTLFQEGVPPVGAVARRARDEGALIELDKHNWPWSMMLVPVIRVDLFELANNHLWRTDFGYRDYGDPAPPYLRVERDAKGWTERGWVDYGFLNYYALLNCGFRLRPTAGTASGVHPVPLGFGRVYVRLEGDFSYDAWLRGLNEGRSFVTTGPMLLVRVNDKDPGAVFRPKGAGPHRYRVRGEARSAAPLQGIELVVNGEVARTVKAVNREVPGTGFENSVDEELMIEDSSWIVVRCFEDRPDKRVRFAHTAPFLVEIAGKPLRPRRAEVEFLIGRIEGELTRNAGVLPEAALDEYREALRMYREIARGAR